MSIPSRVHHHSCEQNGCRHRKGELFHEDRSSGIGYRRSYAYYFLLSCTLVTHTVPKSSGAVCRPSHAALDDPDPGQPTTGCQIDPIKATPNTAPTPIPAFAPIDKPLPVELVGRKVVLESELNAGNVLEGTFEERIEDAVDERVEELTEDVDVVIT
ncbi:hypothetical protein P154DRAFT_536030 [Amniculicola lignicola CBS 123094]|uniref:Uncharacterized protein n=1 Tax=Amniculicola lignicola CBS 123094 TaxID=1392246 RepID=A0A6A5WEY0_9PLEO|nr:hypothetical protein P154DRAFT_536030 [Amniculicola lignicola CBS 123094]